MLRKTLVVLLSLSIPLPALASPHRAQSGHTGPPAPHGSQSVSQLPKGSYGIPTVTRIAPDGLRAYPNGYGDAIRLSRPSVRWRNLALPQTLLPVGTAPRGLPARAFRAGIARSSTVFKSDPGGMDTSSAYPDLTQDGQQGHDETTCVAEAEKRAEDAIQRACESENAEGCETARRVNAALLRAEVLKCRNEYASTEEDSADARRQHDAGRRARLGGRAKAYNALYVVACVVTAVGLVYLFGEDFGWFGDNAPEE